MIVMRAGQGSIAITHSNHSPASMDVSLILQLLDVAPALVARYWKGILVLRLGTKDYIGGGPTITSRRSKKGYSERT